MSPRAAWRLEQLGYDAHDYAGGKIDWLSWGLPYEGSADLVVHHLDRDVPVCRLDDRVDEVNALVREHPRVVVLNDVDVVMGAIHLKDLDGADAGDPAAARMRPGPTTVRPAEETDALAHRMEHARVDEMLVTRSDGVLLGAFRRE